MPEDINNPAAGADNQTTDQGAGEKDQQTGAGEDQGTDTEKKPDTTEAGNEDAGEGEGEGEGAQKDTSRGQDKTEGSQKKDAKVPQKDTQSGEDDNAEPEVRKRLSVQDFIIQRQQKKIAKLKSGYQGGEGDEEGEDEEIAPEDEALIKKVVAPILQPILEKTLQAEDEQEIQEFLKENPDFKPFEAKARRFIQHPSRRQLPIKSIFYEVAGDQLIKIGADRKAKADEKAKQTQTGGGSNRASEGGGKSDWELSKEEFEAKQERIRHGQTG